MIPSGYSCASVCKAQWTWGAKSGAIRTSIVSISKGVLEELKISIPDIKTQKAILTITHLLNKEKVLRQKIETLRETQVNGQIIKALKNIA